VSQHCHWPAFHFEIAVRHSYRRLFMTVGDELRIFIATVIDDRFMHPAKARTRIGTDIFEPQRLDDIHHVVRTAAIRGQDLGIGCRTREPAGPSPAGRWLPHWQAFHFEETSVVMELSFAPYWIASGVPIL
jgi:hypothetical protein